MVELIQARIAFHGGREKLIKDIMDEWYAVKDKSLQASINGYQLWTKEDVSKLGTEVYLRDLKDLSLKIGKSKRAVEMKARNLGIYKSSVKH